MPTGVRVLFVSGTTIGGSGRSQRDLAALLMDKGHQMHILADDESPAVLRRYMYEHLSDLAVRTRDWRVGRLVEGAEALPGRNTTSTLIDGVEHSLTPVPENAFKRALHRFRPDVVVANSISRLALGKLRSTCSGNGLPLVLYLREQTALGHFERSSPPADAFVANSESLVRAVVNRGHSCEFIPSVTDVERTAVTSTREVALLINPIETHGRDLVVELARRLPDIPFVVQESWPLSGEQVAIVEQNVRRLSNLEFRRAAPPGPALYADVRVLLAPHRLDNRPRIVTEAQANSIPVIASDFPGLAEAVGPGGMIFDPDDVNAWCIAVKSMWNSAAAYEGLCTQAYRHSHRPEMDPSCVATQFEVFLRCVVPSASDRPPSKGHDE